MIGALLRLSEISGGAIVVDGKDVRGVPLKTLRQGLGMVHQTPFLFEAGSQPFFPLPRASTAILRRWPSQIAGRIDVRTLINPKSA